jgi:hypothetical protein
MIQSNFSAGLNRKSQPFFKPTIERWNSSLLRLSVVGREVVVELYSYVVDHDTGFAPNPYGGLCTLCRCKFRKHRQGKRNIVELAKVGDWVIGTGGANKKKSAGHGKLIYAMRVDEKPTREEYYSHFSHDRRDNKPPSDPFEKHEQFALVSHHFYYFGANAVEIPTEYDVEKKGPGFRRHFEPADIRRFLEWVTKQFKIGKHGEPCQQSSRAPGRCSAVRHSTRGSRTSPAPNMLPGGTLNVVEEGRVKPKRTNGCKSSC